jgi:DNA polymerase-3 subunit delta'
MQFSVVIGQEEVKKRLINSVFVGRVSHAQLFVGPEGSGALPLAVAYAQYLLCINKQENDSCGQCSSCVKSAKLIHPDIHFVYPIAFSKDVRVSSDLASQWREAFLTNPYLALNDWFAHLSAENKQPLIGVEESVEILKKLSLTTYEGEFKVMIIWLPEKMNLQAANKLLKILEEPTDKTVFLLVTENEEALPRTIVSRTQIVKVNRLSDENIRHALIEKKNLRADIAARIAYLADGNYHAALAYISEQNGNVSLNRFREWMRICFRADVAGMLAWVEEFTKCGRETQKAFLSYSMNCIRECLVMIYAGKKLIRVDGEELDFVQKLASRLDGNMCQKLSYELNEAILHIERNGNAKIIFTDLSLKIMRIVK